MSEDEDKRSLYEILGVAEEATSAEIKKAYRQKASKLHPDRTTSPEDAEEMQKVNRAYGILSDDEKRASYDQFGDTEGELTRRATSMLMSLISEIIDSPESDIIFGAHTKMDTLESRLTMNKNAAEADIARLTRRRKSIRRKSGASIFDRVFDDKIERANEALRSIEAQKEILKIMRATLNEYESTEDNDFVKALGRVMDRRVSRSFLGLDPP